MGKFGDNYFAFLYGRAEVPSQDEGITEKHDRQYHPNGYNPKTDTCKFREKDKVDELKPPSVKDYVKKFKEEFGILLVPYTKANEYIERDSSEGFKEGWKYTTKPSPVEELKAIGLAYDVFSDMKNRFNFIPHLDYLFVANFLPFQGMQPGGLSENDHLKTQTSKLVIAANPPEYSGYAYGHPGEDFKSDCIRHEIGHCCATIDAIEEFMFLQKRLKEEWPKSYSATMLRCSSPYAISTNKVEIIAEMFARATSRDYKKGFMPKPFEDLVYDIMMGRGDE